MESLKEKLKVQLEILKNLVILLIAVGGGTVGLLFKLSQPISFPLVVLGLVLMVGMLFGIVRVGLAIVVTLKEIEEWERR